MSEKRIIDYRDLHVWNEGMQLATEIYEITRGFPREELFGMTSQMRRAAASIPANIAEGFGREHTRPFIQSLRIAQGSLKELETQVMLAERVSLLNLGQSGPLISRCETVGKMLRGLIRSLVKKTSEV